MRSPNRQNGPHVLVDVGAGTLDFTAFNVGQHDGEDQFPIFAREVKPLGTTFLCKHRADEAGVDWKPSPFEAVPDEDQVCAVLRITEDRLAEIDRPFRGRVADVACNVLRAANNQQFINFRQWSPGVRTFLCGGGSSVSCYQKTVAGLEAPIFQWRLRSIRLEAPSDLKAPNLALGDYQRLSVAYGLSFSADDIGQIIPTVQLNTNTPPPPDGPTVGYQDGYHGAEVL